MTPPVTWPNSALKLLRSTLNSSRASSGGVTTLPALEPMSMLFWPSMSQRLELVWLPLIATLVYEAGTAAHPPTFRYDPWHQVHKLAEHAPVQGHGLCLRRADEIGHLAGLGL